MQNRYKCKVSLQTKNQVSRDSGVSAFCPSLRRLCLASYLRLLRSLTFNPCSFFLTSYPKTKFMVFLACFFSTTKVLSTSVELQSSLALLFHLTSKFCCALFTLLLKTEFPLEILVFSRPFHSNCKKARKCFDTRAHAWWWWWSGPYNSRKIEMASQLIPSLQN